MEEQKTKEERWILRMYFANSEEVRNFMKQFGPRIEMERFGKRGVLGIYSRHLADPENFPEDFLVIIQGHVADDVILHELARQIKRDYPNVRVEVVPINL